MPSRAAFKFPNRPAWVADARRVARRLVVLLLAVVLGLPLPALAQTTKKTGAKTTARKATARKTTARRKTTKRRTTARRRGYVPKPLHFPPPDSAFMAQHPNLPADFQPAVMHIEANPLQTFGQEPLANFRAAARKLAAGEKRQLRVLHIGDSHLQADLFSGQLRELLQQAPPAGYGAAGRGFVFPYALAHTNNPGDYRVTSTGAWLGRRSAISTHQSNWGLAGLTAVTTDPGATFTLELRGSAATSSPVTRVRVFWPWTDSSSYQLDFADSANVASVERDSASGSVVWQLKKPVTLLPFVVRRTVPTQYRLLLQGLNLENDQPGLEYGMTGGNGAEVTSYLRAGRLRRHLAVLQPDLLIISLGTNDAYRPHFDSVAFRANYATLLQQILREVPKASVLLTTPGDTYRGTIPNAANTAAARRTILALAEETGCAVWDFNAVMGGSQSINQWAGLGLAQRDRVHYTLRGYRLQGELLYQAIRDALKPTPGGPAPFPALSQPK